MKTLSRAALFLVAILAPFAPITYAQSLPPKRSVTDGDITPRKWRTIDLNWANLAGRDLHGRDFTFRTFVFADLSGADLSEAYLSGANLSGADLSGANLFMANLDGAIDYTP